MSNSYKIHPTSNADNCEIGHRTRISKFCSIFGSPESKVIIGKNSYIGPFGFIEGYSSKIIIGENVSIAQRVTILTSSSPNASLKLQKLFKPVIKDVIIGNHCWIGAHSIIMPGVEIGDYCVIGANSFVTKSYPSYSMIGGSPSKLIRTFSTEEIKKIHS